jgi:hypothetical protein
MIESPTLAPVVTAAEPRPPVARRWAIPAHISRRTAWCGLAVIMAASFALTVAASRRTSTTFDEIIMMAGGARGFETGHFDLAPEHPPLTQYLYGLPVYLGGISYPQEIAGPFPFTYRYLYSRQLFWQSGNDPERSAFLGRLPAALAASLLVLLTFVFTRNRAGRGAGLLAAGLVAFLPDVLAHGGVAYNDLPLATAFLGAVWAFDRVARTPNLRTGLVAGFALALALAIKFSAVALLPVALLLVLVEAATGRERALLWLAKLAGATAVAALATYVTLVVMYRGDPTLAELRYGLDYTFKHVNLGHSAPGYLLGKFSPTGWWYYFPLAFLFKTPAALHLLALLAILGFYHHRTGMAGGVRTKLHAILGSPLRACTIGLLVFGYALLTSSLNIGFRYALPALPLICILIAVGVARLWQHARPLVQAAIVVLALGHATSVTVQYPHFLAYMSEYGPGDGRGDLVLLDSSLDWGQGLLELRRFMRDNDIERVYLSYFGSALPEGYGIDYSPLPSAFWLPPRPAPEGAREPRWAAISATNLHGIYLLGDPLAQFREMEPDTVIANSILIYRVND